MKVFFTNLPILFFLKKVILHSISLDATVLTQKRKNVLSLLVDIVEEVRSKRKIYNFLGSV